MKKVWMILLFLVFVLVGCIEPPVPDIAQTIQDADPNVVVGMDTASTDFYFNTATPVVTSDTRGLVVERLSNRADIEYAEMSLVRMASDFFDSDLHFREGQYLSRDLVIELLRLATDDTSMLAFESAIGLNPPIGTPVNYGDFTAMSVVGEGDLVRPLVYLLEQNFSSINADNEFELEGVAIAVALNPYFWDIDRSIGHQQIRRMTDAQIFEVGQDIVARLLPQVRRQPGLEEVPLLFGLFIMQADTEILPGAFSHLTFVDEGRNSIAQWQEVHEHHFSLPDATNRLQQYDFNIINEFNAFSTNVINHFPHQHSLLARAHVVEQQVYRLHLTFNMSFGGAAEKIAFHHFLETEVMNFSPHYDVRITIRDLNHIHGAIIRLPHEPPVVHRLSW